jgi:hypothetical protein
MSFDYLTLTGLLVTLFYIVMLVMFGRHRPIPKHDEIQIFEYLEDEPYRYGT